MGISLKNILLNFISQGYGCPELTKKEKIVANILFGTAIAVLLFFISLIFTN